jgi:DNA-binding response OmpR family regulator
MMRVLVISPDRSLEQFLRRELSSAKCEILGSRPGPVLVEAARSARPEIAIIHWGDVRRQTAALEQALLRAVRPDVRIILVSSAPSPDDAELVEAGVFYYMPVSPPVRLPDVVRAAARSIREESDRQLRQRELR